MNFFNVSNVKRINKTKYLLNACEMMFHVYFNDKFK